MSIIRNASPQIVLRGADDKSSRVITPEREPIPQHCPLFYIFAKKGPTGRELLSPYKLTSIYGEESFDFNDKYFNHQTRYLQQLVSHGNTVMIQRLVPDDAGIRSNAMIYLDVMETDVPNYKRNSDGTYVTDPVTGKNVVDDKNPTIAGYKIKYIKDYNDGRLPEHKIGTLKSKQGTMVEYIDVVDNTVYSTLTVGNVPSKLAVGSNSNPITIDGLIDNQYEVSFKYGIMTFDKTTKVISCTSEGAEEMTIKTVKKGEEPREHTFTIAGVILGEDETIEEHATLKVIGATTTLTSGNSNAILNIQTDANDFELITSDPNIVKVNKGSKSYSAVKNGTATITVRTKDDNKLPTTFITTVVVKNYSSIKNCSIGVGQTKYVKIINYEKVASTTISPTGYFGINKKDGSIIGIKEGNATLTYLDVRGKVVETLNVTVRTDKQMILEDESETPITYPPIAPDETGVKRSTMYPLFELRAIEKGEYYNNIGFSITSLFGEQADSRIITEVKSMPYYLSLYTRKNKLSSPEAIRTVFSEPFNVFVLKSLAANPNTEGRMDFEMVFKTMWFNESDPLKPLKYREYEDFYFYRDNFTTLTKMFMGKEKEYLTDEPLEWADGKFASSLSWFDFTTNDSEELDRENELMNIFACKSTKSVNYFTVMKSDLKSTLTKTQSVVNIAGDTPIFLEGGTDGTLTSENFEELVVRKMREYADENSEVIDLAQNVESIFYDSGFSLNTKKELVNFITLRKDTSLVLTTHDDAKGEGYDNLSDTRAIAVALKNRLKLAPESEFYGTGVCRAIVIGGSGVLRDGSTPRRIPLSIELLNKTAALAGSGSGMLDTSKMFDKYPGNTVDYLIELQPSFIPAGIKPTLWNEGLVWAQPFDRATYYFPALQTVYDNDTSVLNNYFVMLVLGDLNKLAYRIWSEFTGTSGLTDGEFIDAVTSRANDIIKDRYGTIVTVIPYVTMTLEDTLRGYSWSMTFKLYGSNMRTVATYTTEVYRSSDLGDA